jgi:hypothetical protein
MPNPAMPASKIFDKSGLRMFQMFCTHLRAMDARLTVDNVELVESAEMIRQILHNCRKYIVNLIFKVGFLDCL